VKPLKYKQVPIKARRGHVYYTITQYSVVGIRSAMILYVYIYIYIYRRYNIVTCDVGTGAAFYNIMREAYKRFGITFYYILLLLLLLYCIRYTYMILYYINTKEYNMGRGHIIYIIIIIIIRTGRKSPFILLLCACVWRAGCDGKKSWKKKNGRPSMKEREI